MRLDGDEPYLAATVHHRNRDGQGRIGLVFTAVFDAGRHGEPINAEPHKCAKVGWFPLAELPAETDRYTRACITAWRTRTPLYLSGWQ
ncbi:hypothetical protein L3i22_038920 [Actinoplanes sp. L3-i22]|nr:hypothetical protein L3i22_038920 [Actinoplanes sp. L3-i22]